MRAIVALFTRAWIEIKYDISVANAMNVALFTRAWIEIDIKSGKYMTTASRPFHEGVD